MSKRINASSIAFLIQEPGHIQMKKSPPLLAHSIFQKVFERF